MSIVMSKEQIFTDELIRENARLTVQHEADQQVIQELKGRAASEELEAEMQVLHGAVVEAEYAAHVHMENLSKAVSDLRHLMAGGDRCKVCARKCRMGEDCRPIWRGEEQEAVEGGR